MIGFFPGKHIIHFLVLMMKDFRNFVEFVLHNCILVCGAEQVNLMLQVTNRKPRTLENFSLYACRSQLRAWPGGGDGGACRWTGSLLSTPLTADIGPGSEGAAEGHVAGLGVSFLRLLSPTLGLGRGRRWRGAHLDGGSAFYAKPDFGPSLEAAAEGCAAGR